MSSTSSKSSKNRRSSILKIRQTTAETKVDVVEQPKNRRRVSFHHQKTVKEYDKEKHDLSATSPMKEAVKEAMSDFDSTKSNSTIMSLGTPDRTAGDNQTMMLFRGMMSGGHPSSVHHETRNMSFSIMEDPANSSGLNDTMNIFNGVNHVSMHTKTVDISYRMEESVNENDVNNTLNATIDVFKKPSANQSTRSMSNMTMDMDISKADNTLTEGFEGDDTMAVFGSGPKRSDTTLPFDNTMDVFTMGRGCSDQSRLSQSVLMDVSGIPSPVSSHDDTMAVFGKASKVDESVMMEEATMMEEKKEEIPASPLPKSPAQPSTSHMDDTMNIFKRKGLDESHSPGLDNTLSLLGKGKTHETGDDSFPMEMSMPVQPPISPSQMDNPSPTMNIFKRKGGEERDCNDTMQVFGSKRWREEGDTSMGDTLGEGGSQRKTSQGSQQGSQKSVFMDVEEPTINVFGVKTDETMNESVAMEDEEEAEEMEEKDESIAEISTKTAVEGEYTDKTAITTSNGDRTLDIFNAPGETSQMDVTDVANGTFDVVKSGGDSSQMEMSGRGDDTLGVFGKKEEKEEEVEEREEEEAQEKTLREVMEEGEKEKSSHETPSDNQSMVGDSSIPSENGSENMMEETPVPSQSPVDGNKPRLSTIIEASSRYTAASSQSMRQRLESEEEESKEQGILDRMEESVEEKEEEKEMEMEEEKSARMGEESMVESSSPSASNTTFSFPKRSMLDETRLSDRSMMNVTRSFEDVVLEKITWMEREGEEGGEMEGILRDHATPFAEETNQAILRSESSVEGLLSQIDQSEGSDLLTKSIMKLNPSKVQEHRLLFEWARREAQREWWEKRAEKAEILNGEMEKRMERDEEELAKAKEDLMMMNKLNELKEDVESLEKEVEVGRGLSRNTIDELIGAAKKKEEERDRLRREVTRMELEGMRQSTVALKMMAERCHAVDESIKRKMEEREKNKRELRAYISQLTNNLR